MSIKLISRLNELISEVKSLPTDIYTKSEFDEYSNSSDEEKGTVTKLQWDRIEAKNKIYRKILAFFNAHIPEKEEYFSQLSSITFRPKEGIYNSFHYRNNEEWKSDRKKLINLLELLKSELEESKYAQKKSESIFNSRLFWAIISIVGTTTYFLGTYITTLDYKGMETVLDNIVIEKNNLIEENKMLKDSLVLNSRTEIKAAE
jgi:hypothetical protein